MGFSDRKVLLITASVGSGHNQAARSISEGLAEAGCDSMTIDVMSYVPAWFRWYYSGGYSLAVSRLPFLYGVGFRLNDMPDLPHRNISEKIRIAFESAAASRLVRAVFDYKPDIIVNTHFLAPPILARLGYDNQFIVVTDIQAHRWWYSEGIDRWFVQQPQSANRLIEKWNVPQGKITVSGMPVRMAFDTSRSDGDDLRRELRLPAGRPVVLLSGGTVFTCGPVPAIARGIASICPNACVVVLAGRNKKLLARLGSMAESRDGRVVPMGFTDRVSDLMDAASLMVTKSGGMICAECIAKSLPAVFMPPVPGQEAQNAKYLAECGAARVAEKFSDIGGIVAEMLADGDGLANMQKAAGGLKRPARKIIVEKIIERISNH
ncbi:MAG TPA: glycosyltransferase [Phycisphaerae bacterium]|nr:glycosyltransferase [Phycisphaerae bacterium]HPS52213.1 glycosyltransferase [Phycisphaerae bacterium]